MTGTLLKELNERGHCIHTSDTVSEESPHPTPEECDARFRYVAEEPETAKVMKTTPGWYLQVMAAIEEIEGMLSGTSVKKGFFGLVTTKTPTTCKKCIGIPPTNNHKYNGCVNKYHTGTSYCGRELMGLLNDLQMRVAECKTPVKNPLEFYNESS